MGEGRCDLNLNEVFSVNRRLKNLARFNNISRINTETVAEHSYFVAFYTMLLADKVYGINTELALKLALVHDIEETISGDLPHNVKEKYPEFLLNLEEMNDSIVKDIFSSNGEYLDLWREVRGLETKEARLVHLCDIISVILYTKNEIEMGNTHMIHICEKTRELLNTFVLKYPEFSFVNKDLML